MCLFSISKVIQNKTIILKTPFLEVILICIILLEHIMQQQHKEFSETTKIIGKMLKDSDTRLPRENRVEKLIQICKEGRSAQYLLKLLSKTLNRCQQAQVRLSIVTMVVSVLFELNLKSLFSKIDKILCNHQQKLNKSLSGIVSFEKTQDYLRANVQLPFIRFLKKSLRWKIQQLSDQDLYFVDQGFSYLNKVKSAFHLKTIFHNFSCYYPEHYYAHEMFRVTIVLISNWWNSVCDIGKEIINESIHHKSVTPEDSLFLREAENTQDVLVDFVTVGKFARRLQKNIRLKHINFLPNVLLQLQNPSKLKSSKEMNKQTVLQTKSLKETDEDQIYIPNYSDESKDSGKTSKKDILQSILTLSSI